MSWVCWSIETYNLGIINTGLVIDYQKKLTLERQDWWAVIYVLYTVWPKFKGQNFKDTTFILVNMYENEE